MLLAALPSHTRRDVITARQVSVVSVLFKLRSVLGKASEGLIKIGGHQASYQISSVRQELRVDHQPGLHQTLIGAPVAPVVK